MPSTILSDRALLKLTGDDAGDFLQNIVTSDVAGLTTGGLTFGALLSPQGKVLFDFFILRDIDGYLIDVHVEQQAELTKRLTFYKLRADVQITPVNDKNVVVRWGEVPSDQRGAPDPRSSALGGRSYEADSNANNAIDEWNHHRISVGVPQLIDDYEPGSVFPHDVLMDQYKDAGVDFSKGCYVGQEVVSRMQHRGTARNRFVQVSAESELPPKGSEITADGRALATMGSHNQKIGLALIRIDRLKKAVSEGHTLLANDIPVTVEFPEFVNFGIGDE